jgi:hypothetical protein
MRLETVCTRAYKRVPGSFFHQHGFGFELQAGMVEHLEQRWTQGASYETNFTYNLDLTRWLYREVT